ncbi:MAG: dienelactone hydrolase family protein [Devosia sp.]
MPTNTTLTAADGHKVPAYRAEPAGKPRGGVVVIGEVWGVNKWVAEVADRSARHGFLTIAPNLFDRIAPGFESEDYAAGSVYATMADKMKTFDFAKALADIEAAVKAASAGGKVGITGYCFGGALTWRAAHMGLGLSAASGYYGGGVSNYIDLEPMIPLEMHFGDKDNGIPLEQVEALKARHPDVGIFTYAAGHGFCNSYRPANFDEAACTKASARTLEFFRTHLG